MRHRHLGPKVKYITRRNNIRYRQRPTHSQSLIRRRNKQFRRPVRRMSWDEPDELDDIHNEIDDVQNQIDDKDYEIDKLMDKMTILMKKRNKLMEVKTK